MTRYEVKTIEAKADINDNFTFACMIVLAFIAGAGIVFALHGGYINLPWDRLHAVANIR